MSGWVRLGIVVLAWVTGGGGAPSAFAEHGLNAIPPRHSPDPRLVLQRRTQEQGTSLCSSAFVQLERNDADLTHLLLAGHCVGSEAKDSYAYWTRYVNTSQTPATHSNEGVFTLDQVTVWPEPDVAVVTLPKSAQLDAEPLTLSERLPAKNEKLTVLAFPGASHGGVGPFAFECTSHGIGIFVGNTGIDDGKTRARIEHEMLCPWIISPGGISGAPVLNAQGQMVGLVNAANNVGNGFLDKDTILVESRRSRSHLYFTPLTRGSIRSGKLDLTPSEGAFEHRHEDGSLITYTIQNGKLHGRYRQRTETGETIVVEVQQGIVHGERSVLDPSGKKVIELQYADGVKK